MGYWRSSSKIFRVDIGTMNERIINLKDGTSLYIADTLEYMGKRYVYGLQYDKLTENVTGKYYILEVVILNDKLNLKNIEDKELKDKIYVMFTSRQLENILDN